MKIDASYLSPHVNTAARLEAATKQYKQQFLLSGQFVVRLSAANRQLCRKLDSVVLVGQTIPTKLFTWDFWIGQDRTECHDSLSSLAKVRIYLLPCIVESISLTFCTPNFSVFVRTSPALNSYRTRCPRTSIAVCSRRGSKRTKTEIGRCPILTQKPESNRKFQCACIRTRRPPLTALHCSALLSPKAPCDQPAS